MNFKKGTSIASVRTKKTKRSVSLESKDRNLRSTFRNGVGRKESSKSKNKWKPKPKDKPASKNAKSQPKGPVNLLLI